jgi:hypothetical protein
VRSPPSYEGDNCLWDYHRYFTGILFLTTNRITAFDDAFQSRIHLSLRYDKLTTAAKRQIWSAFLEKAGEKRTLVPFTKEEMDSVSAEDLNGREIKNAVKLALSLADVEDESLQFKHVQDTLRIVRAAGLRE